MAAADESENDGVSRASVCVWLERTRNGESGLVRVRVRSSGSGGAGSVIAL